KAYGKKLTLLPLVMAARFQEAALFRLKGSDIKSPSDLKGKRVGVRAYSQTTGLWLRGELADDYGAPPESINWVTFEDAHVAEYRDPPHARRAAPGESLPAMLEDGAIDAAIFGADAPTDPSLRTVFPDPEGAARSFLSRHGFMPINHLICIKQEIAESRPELVEELMRMFREAIALAGEGAPLSERRAIDSALELAARYAAEQGLTPRRLTLGEIWNGSPAR
ncbi:MAG TPA: phosphate ABC transporter substrate-binding protein, partial [Roseiarcus sp.]|nr:phosphate ABC transporter substrate-binding protein [Roseiarcus sp.]